MGWPFQKVIGVTADRLARRAEQENKCENMYYKRDSLMISSFLKLIWIIHRPIFAYSHFVLHQWLPHCAPLILKLYKVLPGHMVCTLDCHLISPGLNPTCSHLIPSCKCFGLGQIILHFWGKARDGLIKQTNVLQLYFTLICLISNGTNLNIDSLL